MNEPVKQTIAVYDEMFNHAIKVSARLIDKQIAESIEQEKTLGQEKEDK